MEELLEAEDRLREAGVGDAEHRRHERFTRNAAVLVGVLAALLGIASLLGDQASGDVILDQERAADAYTEYQSDSVEHALGTNEVAILAALGQDAAAAVAQQDATAKGAAAGTLIAEAHSFETARDRAERKDITFQLTQGGFQIAIVLVSIGIVARFRPAVFIGASLGAVALLIMADGLGAGVPLPL
jgi:hypothetical protein